MLTQRNKYVPFFMWLFPLLFFAYQFILRLWPSLMMSQIMQQLAIDATGFGVLASFYYYGYAGMQIPVALMLDKFKVRYVLFGCATMCGAATLVFSYTDNFYIAGISRFLIGAGSAVGFLGTSKVISQWFSKDKYASMIGFSFTLGLMGAIYGGKPISILVEKYSWQNVVTTLSVVSIFIGLFTFLCLRSPKRANAHEEKCEFTFKDFKGTLSSTVIWLLGIANLLMVGMLEGFADVWGVQYLMTTRFLSKGDAAELISFIFIGMIFGGPLLALAARRLGNYAVISLCGLSMAAAFCYLIFSSLNNWYMLAALFFCIGIMCCYQVIVFAAGSELVSAKLLGVSIAFLNCLNMLGGSVFHTSIGFIMDGFWSDATSIEGLRLYTAESYSYALMVIPACAILGAGIVAFLGLKLRKKS